jgi:ubiquinone/menaquinone biosynthesis C-methylase UbiE
MQRISFKPDWFNYLHNIREKEIELIEKYLSVEIGKMLEIGAGDGFQSTIFKNYCKELHCTELNESRLKQIPFENVVYKICDVEKIDKYYNNDLFDMAFSSNLFEHLPNPSDALRGLKKCIKKDGISIHIMPNPFFVFSIIIFHYPNFILTRFEKLINRFFFSDSVKKKKQSMDNNLKVVKKYSILSRLLRLPKPHGISSSFLKEIRHFSKKEWINLFHSEGFEVLDVMKGPVFSGYGFGLKIFKDILEAAGFCSEYIYITKNIKENP